MSATVLVNATAVHVIARWDQPSQNEVTSQKSNITFAGRKMRRREKPRVEDEKKAANSNIGAPMMVFDVEVFACTM